MGWFTSKEAKALGKKVKRSRKFLGLSQEEAAKFMGVPLDELKMVEAGVFFEPESSRFDLSGVSGTDPTITIRTQG